MTGTVRTSRLRHLRHRRLDGVTRGAEGTKGIPRLKRIEAWLAARAATAANDGIGDTAALQAFTVANATDIFSAAAHGFALGEGPCVVSTTGTLPDGLLTTELYWVGVIDAGTFYLHRSKEDAVFDTNRVDVADDGAVTNSIARAADIPGLIEWLRQDNEPETIQALTDIDSL